VGEEAGQLVAFEDRDRLGCPVGFLGGFEFGDRVVGQPAAADGVAADLVERDQDDAGGGRRARSFACDQAATRSIVSSRSLQAPIGRAPGSAEPSMWTRTIARSAGAAVPTRDDPQPG
jgi:hypothetical protein